MTKITLFDKTEFYITHEQHQQLERELNKSTDGFITISGKTIKKNAISSILPGGQTEADLPSVEPLHRLAAGQRCRGQFSVQNEINKIARDEGGKEWAQFITNKAWREQVRQTLTAKGEWCDYKTSTCKCEPGYISVRAKFDKSGVGK